MFMHRCLDGTAPRYLTAHYTAVSATTSRHRLCSATNDQLLMLSY